MKGTMWGFVDDMVIKRCGYSSLGVRASLSDAVYYMLRLSMFRLSRTLRHRESSASAM